MHTTRTRLIHAEANKRTLASDAVCSGRPGPARFGRKWLFAGALSAGLLVGAVGCGGSSSSSSADAFEDGIALQEAGKWEEAIAVYNAVIHDDPEHAGALFNRGVSKLERRDAKGALADFDAVLALSPDDLDAKLWRGSAYLAQGETGRAIADFDAVIEQSPLAPEAYALRAEAHLEAGTLEQALRDADAAARLSPDDPAAYARRAAVFDALGEPEAAEVERSLAAVTAQIAADPGDVEARARRGAALLVMDEPELALIDLDLAVAGLPDNAALRMTRGQCYASLNLPAQALVDLTAVTEMPGADPAVVSQARLSRAAVYESAGGYADAIAEYELLRAEASPVGINATVRLARLRAGCPEEAQRRPSQAYTLATEALARFDAAAAAIVPVDPTAEPDAEALETVSPDNRWFFLDTLAAAAFADGRLNLAVTHQQQAAQSAPEDVRPAVVERLQAYRDARE